MVVSSSFKFNGRVGKTCGNEDVGMTRPYRVVCCRFGAAEILGESDLLSFWSVVVLLRYGTITKQMIGRITPCVSDVASCPLSGVETSQSAMVGLCPAGRALFGAKGEARVDSKQEAL